MNYSIIGTEFDAIFISTSEAIQNGRCIHETKSISDRYVFNTAITRSRALVVAVGNPFLLMHLEEELAERYQWNARCWTTYMRQCIDCNTFSYSVEIMTGCVPTSILLEKIYANSSPSGNFFSKPLDGIIKGYKDLFKEQQACGKAKLTLSTGQGGRISWKIDECGEKYKKTKENEISEGIIDRYLCKLEVDTYYSARAIPHDKSKGTVRIQGRSNLKPAFDGDTIEVGIFHNISQTCYGRVEKVVKSRKSLTFLCRVSDTNPIKFYPIDGKSPIFYNLPRLSRGLLKDKNRIESYLKSKDVVVFKPPHDLKCDRTYDVPLPEIKQVIPLSIGKNMLYLVSFVKWSPKHDRPLGIVIDVFSTGFTQFHAERMLKFEHSVYYNDSDIENTVPIDVPRESNLQLFTQVLTIDPEGAKNLDDALSLGRLEESSMPNKYQLGVHIVNAAKHIEPDSDEDKKARDLGTSVYGGGKDKVMHMLSSDKSRSCLSLIPGKIRDVISVTCTVTINKDLIVSDVKIQPAQVKSCYKLTYATAQSILEGKEHEIIGTACTFKDPSLYESIKVLYEIAFFFRHQRLNSDAAYAYDISDPGEEKCWQAHLLVEELMIWANNEVAKRIHSYYPEAALLRRQLPPHEEKIKELVDKNKNVMMNSLCLSRYVKIPDISPSTLSLPILVLQELRIALQREDYKYLIYLLTSDLRYPQLAAIASKIIALSQRSEYCCTTAGEESYDHKSLMMSKYTHFTSPMRRYIDIQVQRILLATLKDSEVSFSHDEHDQLCHHLNAKMQNSKKFERKMNQYIMGSRFLSSSKIYTAVITDVENKFIHLDFFDLELKYFPLKYKKVKISNISTHFKVASLKGLDISPSVSSSPSAEMIRAFHMSQSSDDLTENESSDDLTENETISYHLDTETFSFSLQNSCIEVDSSQWREILDLAKSQIHLQTPMNRKQLDQKLTTIGYKVPSLEDSKRSDTKYLFMECDIKEPWKSPGVLKVWLTWSMRNYILCPVIQMLEISPLFSICIQHNNNPAECFSDYDLPLASKNEYRGIQEYINLWKKVLLAEAAGKSVQDCKAVIIRDFSLEWPQLKLSEDNIDDAYFVPSGPVKLFLPKSFMKNCFIFFPIYIGDFICLRCHDKTTPTRAVFHFVVHKVDIKGDPATVLMESVGRHSCYISKQMKKMLESNDYYCEAQIIQMHVSYR